MFYFLSRFKDFFQRKPEELFLPGIVFFGFVFISLCSVSLFSSLNDTRDGVVTIHLEIAKNSKNQIEGFLNENVRALNDLAQILSVNSEKKLMIDRFFKERRVFEQIAVLNTQGQEILKSSQSLVFSPEDLKDLSWSESFVIPMEGEVYLSGVYFSERSEPFLTIGLPIRSSSNQISGILLAELSLAKIWNIVAEIEVGKSGQVYLVDSGGYLVAHPNIDLVLKRTNLFTRKVVEKVIVGRGISKGLEKEEEYFNEKGEKAYVVGLPIETTGWGVFVEESIKDSWAAYRKIRNLGLISILAVISLLLILFFNIQTLVKTFRDLRKSKEALEESKASLEVRIQARTRELRELAQKLEEQVKERTKELQEKLGELEKFNRLAVGRELKMIELKEEITKLKEQLQKHDSK